MMEKHMDYNLFYAKASQHYNYSRLDEGDVFNFTLRYIVSHLPSRELRVLDIGCGTGEYGFALSQIGYDVHGIDKSSDQIEIASKRIPASIGDVLLLEQKDNSIDAVLMIMMIHQLSDTDLSQAFAEVVRVLKPGGVVIIKTCFEDEIANRITSKYFPSCLKFDQMRFPSMQRLVSVTPNLVLRFCDKVSISASKPKTALIQKFLARGASNIGMLSTAELEKGIAQILKDYSDVDIIEINFDNTFLVFECCKEAYPISV